MEYFIDKRTIDGLLYGVYDSNNNLIEPGIAAGYHRVPYNYKELEYIKSTGTQYIQLDFCADEYTGFEIKFSTTDGLTEEFDKSTNIFGCCKAMTGIYAETENILAMSTFNRIYPGQTSTHGTVQHLSDAGFFAYIVPSTSENEVIHTASFTYCAATASQDEGMAYRMVRQEDEKSSYHVITQHYYTPVCMTLFALNTNGVIGHYSNTKLYHLKFYKKKILTHDFIPCENASGVIGLYDLCTHTFHINSGTGTFEAGPEVTDIDRLKGSDGGVLFSTGTDEENFTSNNICSKILNMFNETHPKLPAMELKLSKGEVSEPSDWGNITSVTSVDHGQMVRVNYRVPRLTPLSTIKEDGNSTYRVAIFVNGQLNPTTGGIVANQPSAQHWESKGIAPNKTTQAWGLKSAPGRGYTNTISIVGMHSVDVSNIDKTKTFFSATPVYSSCSASEFDEVAFKYQFKNATGEYVFEGAMVEGGLTVWKYNGKVINNMKAYGFTGLSLDPEAGNGSVTVSISLANTSGGHWIGKPENWIMNIDGGSDYSGKQILSIGDQYMSFSPFTQAEITVVIPPESNTNTQGE